MVFTVQAMALTSFSLEFCGTRRVMSPGLDGLHGNRQAFQRLQKPAAERDPIGRNGDKKKENH